MNNGNIILRCINAQPTTEYSHGELIPLISDGSSVMAGRCMWRHTRLTRGKSLPPSAKIDAENLLGRHSSEAKWKRCLVHQHSRLATHSFTIPTTVWLQAAKFLLSKQFNKVSPVEVLAKVSKCLVLIWKRSRREQWRNNVLPSYTETTDV